MLCKGEEFAMKILFVNGSPRGRFSVTLQTCRYLEQRFPRHSYETLNVGAGLESLERDLRPAAAALARAELVIFAYPVYMGLPPYPLCRFFEWMRAGRLPVRNRCVTQITTSQHVFDDSARRYTEENCLDCGMRVIPGLSAGMEDLLSEAGREQAEDFFRHALWCAEKGVWEQGTVRPEKEAPVYEQSLAPVEKQAGFDTVILADLREGDESLRALIKDFDAVYPYKTRFVNLADFPFQGGCLGCLNCALSGQCVYRDGFDALLQSLRKADALVFAFTLQGHGMGARFKLFEDRQFCLGQRFLSFEKPVAYLCHGDLREEKDLLALLRGRASLSRSVFAGAATDRDSLTRLAAELCWALENEVRVPQDFPGAGAGVLTRDMLWLLRGLFRADHRFYRTMRFYDFPHRRFPRMLSLLLLGAVMRSARLRRILGKRMNDGLLAPYERVIENERTQREQP